MASRAPKGKAPAVPHTQPQNLPVPPTRTGSLLDYFASRQNPSEPVVPYPYVRYGASSVAHHGQYPSPSGVGMAYPQPMPAPAPVQSPLAHTAGGGIAVHESFFQAIQLALEPAISAGQDRTSAAITELATALSGHSRQVADEQAETREQVDALAKTVERTHKMQLRATQAVLERVVRLEQFIGLGSGTQGDAATSADSGKKSVWERLKRIECDVGEVLEKVSDPEAALAIPPPPPVRHEIATSPMPEPVRYEIATSPMPQRVKDYASMASGPQTPRRNNTPIPTYTTVAIGPQTPPRSFTPEEVPRPSSPEYREFGVATTPIRVSSFDVMAELARIVNAPTMVYPSTAFADRFSPEPLTPADWTARWKAMADSVNSTRSSSSEPQLRGSPIPSVGPSRYPPVHQSYQWGDSRTTQDTSLDPDPDPEAPPDISDLTRFTTPPPPDPLPNATDSSRDSSVIEDLLSPTSPPTAGIFSTPQLLSIAPSPLLDLDSRDLSPLTQMSSSTAGSPSRAPAPAVSAPVVKAERGEEGRTLRRRSAVNYRIDPLAALKDKKPSASASAPARTKRKAEGGSAGPKKRARKSAGGRKVKAEAGLVVDPAMFCEWPEKLAAEAGVQRQFVECSGCKLWYHHECVGFTPDDLRLDRSVEWDCAACESFPDSAETRRQTMKGREHMCSRPDCSNPGPTAGGSDVFFVERIVGRRTEDAKNPDSGPKYAWLVKWDGYPMEQSTWEPEDGLNEKLILDFYEDAEAEGLSLHYTVPMLLLEAVEGGCTPSRPPPIVL